MNNQLRVGGVPEHFNAPFHLATQDCAYGDVEVNWQTFPGGTGAMADALKSKEADICVMLTEGAVCQIANGAPLRIVGTYVASSLHWGVHKKAGRSVPSNPIFGVSRMGSGSHLMAFIYAKQLGIDINNARFEVVGGLDGAKTAMAKEEIDLFLWEKFTSKHMCDCGEWEVVSIVPSPWPCFSFVAREEVLQTKTNVIRRFIEVTSKYCRSFKKNGGDSSVAYVSKSHAMSIEDARTWLNETEWLCMEEMSEKALVETLRYLTSVNMCKQVEHVSSLLADFVALRKEMPDDMYSWRVNALRNWLEAQEQSTGRKPTMDDLSRAGHLDQYHYLGLEANDELIDILQLGPNDIVLDVGSGIGGPARYISWKSGCQIVGVDVQKDLVDMSNEVSELVGLKKVHFECKDASRLTEENVYTSWYSLLVILHIPKVPRELMFHRVYDSLKDDAPFCIEDMVAIKPFTEKDASNLANVVGASYVPSLQVYQASLEAAGFVDITFEDLTQKWVEWSAKRFKSFVASKAEQRKMHGEAIVNQREKFYAVIAELFAGGCLGGARITGRKPSSGAKRLCRGRAAVGSSSIPRFGAILETRQTTPTWMCGDHDSGVHDSLQFHFFHKECFFVFRIFGTKSLQRAWAWIAREADNWVPKVLFDSDEQNEKWISDPTSLKVTIGAFSITENAGGVQLQLGDKIMINAQEQEIKRWSVPGQLEEVIHRPDLAAKINFEGAELTCTGYSKRYYGPHYGPRWAYHFIQGHIPGADTNRVSAIWTADARFGDNKYNYFKIIENGKLSEGVRDTCYHQGYIGRCVLNGEHHTVSVTPLGEQRTILKSAAMDSEMIETVCILKYNDGRNTRTGFGFYERCMGTLA
eukprot:GEMP01008113.1.p1 GENE.GEMP01008113.1~~GEMP01008113.1.p1  ORF type:complete len:884 (+),score=177.90 GEMP01008113.1:60-2654(+)